VGIGDTRPEQARRHRLEDAAPREGGPDRPAGGGEHHCPNHDQLPHGHRTFLMSVADEIAGRTTPAPLNKVTS